MGQQNDSSAHGVWRPNLRLVQDVGPNLTPPYQSPNQSSHAHPSTVNPTAHCTHLALECDREVAREVARDALTDRDRDADPDRMRRREFSEISG